MVPTGWAIFCWAGGAFSRWALLSLPANGNSVETGWRCFELVLPLLAIAIGICSPGVLSKRPVTSEALNVLPPFEFALLKPRWALQLVADGAVIFLLRARGAFYPTIAGPFVCQGDIAGVIPISSGAWALLSLVFDHVWQKSDSPRARSWPH